MPDRPDLRIAVPNKGSLSEGASEMLREAGYRQRSDGKELVLLDERNHVEFYYLRPRDIAVYVGEGKLDLGITGRDMLIDSGVTATEVLPLGFGASRFRFAGRAGEMSSIQDLVGKRLATSYPGLVKAHLAEHGIETSVVKLDGAVEVSIRLGVADAIADVVETGTSLRKAGLAAFGDTILESEAVLISRTGAAPTGLDGLVRRLDGVLTARNYVLVDYDIPEDKVDDAFQVTPGKESPTVSPLAKEGWVAVRAMVPADQTHLVMDDLWEIGARAILVTDIAACRL